MAFTQLKTAVKDQLTLAKDEKTGKVTYTRNKNTPGDTLSAGTRKLMAAIDDHTIEVNVTAVDSMDTFDSGIFITGAFLGNMVTDKYVTTEGLPSKVPLIETRQEVNPCIAANMDECFKRPGASILHEVTESFEGGLEARESGPAPRKMTTELSLQGILLHLSPSPEFIQALYSSNIDLVWLCF